MTVGYVGFEDLNKELQDMLGGVISAGHYMVIDPLPYGAEWSNEGYPENTSTFVMTYIPNTSQPKDAVALSWLEELYGKVDNIPPSTFTVTTTKITEGNVPKVVQKVELLEEDSIDNIYFRTVLDEGIGHVWSGISPLTVSTLPILPAVRTVNYIAPDIAGNVNTDFGVIDPIEPWVLWNTDEYPDGVSEFVTFWDKAMYAQYIQENPSFDALPEGKIMVRTHKVKSNNLYEVWQEIDTSEDGIFHATFARIGIANGEWGEINSSASSHVQHIMPLSPNAHFNDYPSGISIFAVNYNENDLSWYEELDLMPVVDYENYSGHKPDGKVAVTSFKNKTLLTQIIQIYDSSRSVGTVTRYWTVLEGRWTGRNNRTNGIDGKVKSVNGIRPDHLGNVSISGGSGDITVVDNLTTESSTSALSAGMGKQLQDNATLLQTKVDNHIATGYATVDFVGHVKPDNVTIVVDNKGVISAVDSGNLIWDDF